VQTTLPPYALPPLAFPFRHLAALAGRAPIGGAREVALACFLAARLASDRLAGVMTADSVSARGVGARGWLATLAVPAPVRASLARSLELCTSGSLAELAAEFTVLGQAAGEYLEPAARGELDRLAAQLGG
jgi:hypothetical protein